MSLNIDTSDNLASLFNRSNDNSQYFLFISTPIPFLFNTLAAIKVVPDPKKGSNITSST